MDSTPERSLLDLALLVIIVSFIALMWVTR